MITSRSLHKSNIVIVFKDHAVAPPENNELAALYHGEAAKGMQLVDDPLMRMKVLDVPAKGLQIAWEARRLRVEDMRGVEPEESDLVSAALTAYETLAAPRKIFLDSFGFNFEVYYQTKDVIRINDRFNELSGRPLEVGEGLMDFGWQWTIVEKDGKSSRGYFLKVTAPLEFTMHHNAHFAAKALPPRKDVTMMFQRAYQAMGVFAGELNL